MPRGAVTHALSCHDVVSLSRSKHCSDRLASLDAATLEVPGAGQAAARRRAKLGCGPRSETETETGEGAEGVLASGVNGCERSVILLS